MRSEGLQLNAAIQLHTYEFIRRASQIRLYKVLFNLFLFFLSSNKFFSKFSFLSLSPTCEQYWRIKKKNIKHMIFLKYISNFSKYSMIQFKCRFQKLFINKFEYNKKGKNNS